MENIFFFFPTQSIKFCFGIIEMIIIIQFKRFCLFNRVLRSERHFRFFSFAFTFLFAHAKIVYYSWNHNLNLFCSNCQNILYMQHYSLSRMFCFCDNDMFSGFNSADSSRILLLISFLFLITILTSDFTDFNFLGFFLFSSES